MIGLDTNVLLRWLIDETIWPDDAPEQTLAAVKKIVESGETFFVNHVVIAETVWVLTRRMKQPRSIVVDVMERLIDASNVSVENKSVINDALSAFRDGPGDFADHLIAAINASAGCTTTLTFDRKASCAGKFTRLIPENVP